MALDWLAIVTWVLLYLGIGALALPVMAALCPRLPERGAGLAFAGGLAIMAFVGYWIGQIRFGAIPAIIGLMVLAAAAAVALRRGVSISVDRYATAGLVFVAAFALMIGIRVADPAAWPGGGEKFLDHGLLAALLRAPGLPPEDMWFAGEPVQYYYGGHMLAALLAELANTSASHAYNYALAGYYALYVTTAYGLAGAIAAGAGRSYDAGGLLGAFFVGIASNLAPPIRLVAWALPDGLGRGLLSLASLERKGLALGPSKFDFWHASRVIDGGVTNGDTWQYINEFPLFAFLNGDMHAHMMSPPFLMLAVALGYSYYRTPAAASKVERLVPLVLLSPVIGLLLIINTWDVPTALGLTALTVFFAPARPMTLLPDRLTPGSTRTTRLALLKRETMRALAAGGLTILVGLGALLATLPWVLGPGSVRGIGFLADAPADVPGLLVVFGSFLVISLLYVIAHSSPVRRALRHPVVWGGVLLAFALASVLGEAAVAVFLPVFLVAGWGLLRGREGTPRTMQAAEPDGPGLGFETVVLVGVLGLLILIEFIYVVERAGPGAYNTMFKYYVHVWALWGIVTGAVLPAFLQSGANRFSFGPAIVDTMRRSGGSMQVDARWRHRFRQVAVVVAVLLIVSLTVYGVFGLAWKYERAEPPYTLDARAYVADAHPGEYQAIEWLDDRAGTPTIVTAPGEHIYRWVNAPSSLTGIPTVAGWAEQIGYRGPTVYWNRVEDVNTLFAGSPADRARLLRSYDVRYIYVGPIEHDRYSGADLRFADEPGISVAHRSGDVIIYRVDQDRLQSG